jgi:hypothetical protein
MTFVILVACSCFALVAVVIVNQYRDQLQQDELMPWVRVETIVVNRTCNKQGRVTYGLEFQYFPQSSRNPAETVDNAAHPADSQDLPQAATDSTTTLPDAPQNAPVAMKKSSCLFEAPVSFADEKDCEQHAEPTGKDLPLWWQRQTLTCARSFRTAGELAFGNIMLFLVILTSCCGCGIITYRQVPSSKIEAAKDSRRYGTFNEVKMPNAADTHRLFDAA